MFLTCEQKDLLNAARLASQAVNLNNSLPVLNNILLKAENKKLKFVATNLEISIVTDIPAEIRNEGTLTIPARLFSNYAQLLKPGPVKLQKGNQDNDLKISQTNPPHILETTIKGISAEDFPSIPQTNKEASFESSSADLLEAFSQVAFAASKESVRPTLTGIFFQATKNQLSIAATDSYRLAEKIIKLISPPAKEYSFILPTRAAFELIRILEREKTKVKIDIAANQISFLYQNIEFTSRLIEGSYPDYTKNIPQKHITTIKIQKEELITAVKRVKLFTDLNAVRLEIDTNKKLQISSEQTQTGKEKAEIAAVITGAENSITLNANYLLEALAVLKGNEISLELEGEAKIKPAILRSVKDTNYFHLVMPLKV